MYLRHPELFKCITVWVRYCSNMKEIVWVKGHSGIRGNMEADKLAGKGTLMEQTKLELNLTTLANMIPLGAKLATMSQKDFYQGIKKMNRPQPQSVEWRFGFMPVRTSTGYRLLAIRCQWCFLAT